MDYFCFIFSFSGTFTVTVVFNRLKLAACFVFFFFCHNTELSYALTHLLIQNTRLRQSPAMCVVTM